ncbi:MAG: DNA repair protein RadC [Clostridia bacterium]|nr:DNA repair protein RadC [Clostridia bacterium]
MGLHDGHRDRLRNRFLENGLETFYPHNVLELILFYAIPRKDTNELAHNLLNRFGSFHAVLDAPIEELCKVPGIGYNTAVLLKTYLPVARYYAASKGSPDMILDSSELCGNFLLSNFIGLTEEKTLLLCMDNRCKFLACVNVADGDMNSVGVSTRKLVETVLKTGATCVVLAHNHPGGVAIPSPGDVESTKKVAVAMKSIGVSLLDHIIVANDDYVSMAQSAEFKGIFNF